MALVTLTEAWSGFAAAKWGTESRLQLAAASSARAEANRADLAALTLRNFDASTFNAWFIAYTLGSPQKMAIAEKRFRPEFRVAFEAWLATDPDTNPHAPPGPTYMPQYHLVQQDQVAALDAAADRHTSLGDHAGIVGDAYVRITVVLAGVLFLVGIGSRFSVAGVRYALVGVGGHPPWRRRCSDPSRAGPTGLTTKINKFTHHQPRALAIGGRCGRTG